MQTKPLLDIRLRYEDVYQVPFKEDAQAVTLRTRAGFETGTAFATSLLVEGTWTTPFDKDYNSTVNGRTQYPTVADPTVLRLNRLQLTNTTIPDTTVILGRQRINLDDQRFVGSVNWRQTEQTFDAVRVVSKPISGLTIDATYFDKVNRVYGPDSPQGSYTGDNYLVNLSYLTGLGKVTGFAYLLEFDHIPVFTPEKNSSQTYGGRFAGAKDFGEWTWNYAASVATQKQYANNPLTFSNDYYRLDLSGTYQVFTAGAGYEVLDGNGVKGFTTPLATLHIFQGWAEQFLTDPANGVEDFFVTAGLAQKDVGIFSLVSLTAFYHRFDAAHIDQHYGNEADVELFAKWRNLGLRISYADYQADHLFTNTHKFWVALEYNL